MNLSRRGFLGGLLAVVSAPAIVRVESLMPVRAEIIRPTAGEILRIRLPNDFSVLGENAAAAEYGANSFLNIQMITREAVRLFQNSNAFIQSINSDFERDFGSNDGINWHPPRPKNQITFAEWSRNAA